MYKELIKLIELERHTGNPVLQNFKIAYNKAIDDIIEVIKASEPPELDAPDSEGWWWNTREFAGRIMIACVEVEEANAEGEFDYPVRYDRGKDIKWQKAIVPQY